MAIAPDQLLRVIDESQALTDLFDAVDDSGVLAAFGVVTSRPLEGKWNITALTDKVAASLTAGDPLAASLIAEFVYEQLTLAAAAPASEIPLRHLITAELTLLTDGGVSFSRPNVRAILGDPDIQALNPAAAQLDVPAWSAAAPRNQDWSASDGAPGFVDLVLGRRTLAEHEFGAAVQQADIDAARAQRQVEAWEQTWDDNLSVINAFIMNDHSGADNATLRAQVAAKMNELFP